MIEQAPSPASAAASAGGDHHGLSLPTVSINGATGQELDTALGTLVHVHARRRRLHGARLGAAAAADAAARAL